MINDYDFEIIYHVDKVKVVVDVLIQKTAKVHIRGRSKRIELVSNLLEQVRDAQVKALNPKNVLEEKM